METWKEYLFLVIACLIVQGFFAMVEMAAVSFNKIRLQYYVGQGSRRAVWLSRLLSQPTYLFGTTLICINGALQLGSEASRRLYESLSLSPDLAPLTQVVIVLIFAEIAPLMAGRRHAEHAAMIGIPLLYGISLLLRPVIWLFDALCQGVNRLLGAVEHSGAYLSREEFQNILEEQDVDETTPTVRRIFALKNQTARDLMRPMARVMAVSSACTVGEMRTLLRDKYLAFVPIYHKSPVTIVGIAYPRDLLRLGAHKRAREKARSPWFIAENSSILSILKQFRRNNQTVAVVLDSSGGAVGVLTLDEIIDAIFGQADTWVSLEEPEIDIPSVVIDRAFPGEMEVIALNRLYHTTLEENEGETLGEMMRRILGHAPVVGESIKLGALELTAEEVSLLGVKTVSVRTVRR